MVLNMLTQFNWVDIVIIVLFVRLGFEAIKMGIAVEAFKLLGSLLAVYLAFHYFTSLADFIAKALSLETVPIEFIDFFCFNILWSLGYGISILFRLLFSHFVKIETISPLNRWGALALGMVRAFFVVSMTSFMLSMSSVSYLKDSVSNSFLGSNAVEFAPGVYRACWNGLFSKLMPEEKFNNTVDEILNSVKR